MYLNTALTSNALKTWLIVWKHLRSVAQKVL